MSTFEQLYRNYHPNLIISTLRKNITHSIMINGIVKVNKLGIHNKNQPDMNNNLITVPGSISNRHNTKDK